MTEGKVEYRTERANQEVSALSKSERLVLALSAIAQVDDRLNRLVSSVIHGTEARYADKVEIETPKNIIPQEIPLGDLLNQAPKFLDQSFKELHDKISILEKALL